MHWIKGVIVALLSLVIVLPMNAAAQKSSGQPAARFPQSGWSTAIRGGGVYQWDTGLDDGGNYDASRFSIQASQGYAWDPRTSVSLSLGYSFDGYSFSGDTGLAAAEPWENIHTVSLGLPLRWGIGDKWAAFLIPTVRSTGESGASFDRSITGGGFAGVAYRFGPRLTIGPGVGVISQIEDDPTIFPILIINWKISDSLSFETGGGLGATLGPGLQFAYQLNSKWRFTVGGRYESLRFRLDNNGRIPDGVGEDKSFPLFAGCTYSWGFQKSVGIVGGVELGGELRLEDEDGNRIDKTEYDPGAFIGLTFNFRF